MKTLMLVLANAALFTGVANWIIADKEDLIENGRRVVLEMAPYDPRSYMQGDYMELRYVVANQAARATFEAGLSDGKLVVGLDERDVATFRRIHTGEELKADEHLLRYRVRHRMQFRDWLPPRVAPESFFFQEGMGKVYAVARFAELRVDEAGGCVIVGLLDQELQRLPGEPR